MPARINEIGNKYGKWTVIAFDENSKGKPGGARWICECSCSQKTRKSILGQNLRNGRSTSCGCFSTEIKSKRMTQYNDNRRIDLTGQKFGLLTAIERTDNKNPQGCYYWKCKCDCGNEHYVTSSNLKNGNVKSCGCTNSFGAANIKKILQDNGIVFKTEYTFPDLVSSNGSVRLRFDFAIFTEDGALSHLIEYDGETHYRYSGGWHTKEKYENLLRNDKKKNEYCQQHNIKLKRISYLEKDTITLKKLMEV